MTTPIRTTLLAAGLAALGGMAVAQAVPFDEIDADGDGELSREELTATFGDETANLLLQQDGDGSGGLNVAEVAAGVGAGAAAGDAADDDPATDEAVDAGEGMGVLSGAGEAGAEEVLDDDDDGSSGASDESADEEEEDDEADDG